MCPSGKCTHRCVLCAGECAQSLLEMPSVAQLHTGPGLRVCLGRVTERLVQKRKGGEAKEGPGGILMFTAVR